MTGGVGDSNDQVRVKGGEGWRSEKTSEITYLRCFFFRWMDLCSCYHQQYFDGVHTVNYNSLLAVLLWKKFYCL